MKKLLILLFVIILTTTSYGTFDKDKPASSTSLRASNPEILANWSALETAIGQDHEFSTGGSNTGEHLQIKFNAPISTPTNAANKGWLYSKDVSAVVELHWLDESGNELQVTSGGDLFSSAGLIVTGASTFNGSITLGAGDDLIGSSTSDITFNTNKFTVAGDTGNTLVAGTLDVTGNIDPTTYETTNGGFLNSDTMAGAADTSIASSDSIVKYVTLDAGDVLMHDSEGAFQNADINGTKTKVYTKYFTGTLDADSATDVAHGITNGATNILSVASAAFEDTGFVAYQVSDNRAAATATVAFQVLFDNTNIKFINVGSQVQGNGYKIRVDYIVP